MEQSTKPTEAPKPKNRTMVLAIIIVVILVVVGVGVYILTQNRTPPPAGTPVSIFDGQGGAACNGPANCGYNPSTLHVKIGTNNTVTWTNTGNLPHTVTSNQTANGSLPSFDSGSGGLQKNAQFTFTFAQAGTYYYYCSIHPTQMKAVVVVSA